MLARRLPVPILARAPTAAWSVAALLIVCLATLGLVTAQAEPATSQASAGSEPAIAAGGFDRPERIVALDGVYGVDVAAAPATGTGPLLYWQDRDGLMERSAVAGDPERSVASLGVRGVWAGAARGDPVLVWRDRNLSTGASTLVARWRGETREVLATRQTTEVAVLAGSDAPRIVVAMPSLEGWRLMLWSWSGQRRSSEPRPDTVTGIDAAPTDDGVRLAWLEGREERVLGRVESNWRAYRADWPDGDERPGRPVDLGAAARRTAGDSARIGGPERSEVAFPAEDGSLVVAHVDGTRRSLGRGVPVGWLGERWIWREADRIRRATPDGTVETVLRLPGEPQRLAAAEADGVIGMVWSSGRYLGGLEVWGVSDAQAYRSGPLERFAVAMGWDPWRIGTAAGGHVLLSSLVALIGAMALAPLWWLGAGLLARRRATSERAVVLEGAALGVGSIVALAVPIALRVARLGGPGAALLVDPAWLTGGALAGLLGAFLVLGRRDLEATFGRALAAFVAGFIVLAVVAFGTLSAWQRLIAQVA